MAIGLGTLLLKDLGEAALLFINEVTSIGAGLGKIATAWEPINDKGDTIEVAIRKGTEILTAIGVVCAALGVASVASVGLLPLAIKLGSKMLSDLSGATKSFIDEIGDLAQKMTNELAPKLEDFNDKLPSLNSNLEEYVSYMETFAEDTKNIAKSQLISAFSTFVSDIIGFFSKDPISKLAKDVEKEKNQAKDLNDKLTVALPELAEAISLMETYFDYLKRINEIINDDSNQISLEAGMFADMTEVGKNLVSGLAKGMKDNAWEFNDQVNDITKNALSQNTAHSYGWSFGKQIVKGISDAMKNSTFAKLRGTVNTDVWGTTFTFDAYATGGFPSTGEMFMARESGPELVGRIGNRTAVANNDQIIAGIQQGVYNAMVSVQGDNQNVNNVYIGNRQVYKSFSRGLRTENNRLGTNTVRV